MQLELTVVFQKVREGYIGFVEELPGANTQGDTLEEARANLREAVLLVLDANRHLAQTAIQGEEVIQESPFAIGSEAVQAIYILPFAATPVAVALIWRIMLNPEIGVLNYVLRSVGLPGSLWVSSPQTVIPALVMVDVWKWTPMITLIVQAGLNSLPHVPYEAARVDGASALQIFWYITLPLIRPVLIAALMLRAFDNLKEFDIIYTITQGGPGVASETLYLYSYNVAFNFFKAGYGSALMVVVFLIVLGFNVIMNRLRLRNLFGLPSKVEGLLNLSGIRLTHYRERRCRGKESCARFAQQSRPF